MKMIPLVTATLLAAASTAQAANVSSPVETLTVQTGKNSLAFDSNFSNVQAGDTFADRFDFTLGGKANVRFSATSTAAGQNDSLDLTGFGIFDAVTNLMVAPGKLSYLNLDGEIDKWTLSANNLAAGSYYFQVAGTMLAPGGSFAANGTITVSPVPEPAMPAMLLGGLAMLAFVARRKAQ
jgi:hypothetical protein